MKTIWCAGKGTSIYQLKLQVGKLGVKHLPVRKKLQQLQE
jgi:hypothetical protein